MTRKLTLADITDARAYERERPTFLQDVIALKKKRRVALGPFVTLVFENRTTIRFQIQEMARAERMATDEQIQTELDIYNPLIGEAGELSMTMFIELTSQPELREWLPRLVGIERSIVFLIGEGDEQVEVPVSLDPAHESQLTRDEVTASVHYLHASLSSALVDRFRSERVAVASRHPEYGHEVVLPTTTKETLVDDWSDLA